MDDELQTVVSTPVGKKHAAKMSGTPTISSTSTQPTPGGADSDDEGDVEMVDLKAMQAFARQVQQAPSTPHSKAPKRVIIPKRGEKDFEPLNETQTIQEKMLRESRQALFDGLSGVRGTSSKNMSHSVWCYKNSPFPQVKVLRGSAFLTMGHTIRPSIAQIQAHIQLKESLKGKEKAVPALQSSVELLPEEALYLLERGSMTIWQGENEGEFHDGHQGYDNMTEMTVLEAFSSFIGMEGLSLERYQVYAGLRRLGYTVQRTPCFLPQRFRKPLPYSSVGPIIPSTSTVERMSATLKRWIGSFIRIPSLVWTGLRLAAQSIARAFTKARGSSGSLLDGVSASNYTDMYKKLRVIPAGHSHPVANQLNTATGSKAIAGSEITESCEDIYRPLVSNPYLPFYHVWKPNTHWTNAKWDKGSDEGLKTNPPAFWIGVVDARSVPVPTLPQMDEVFGIVPDVPTPYLRRRVNPPSDKASLSAGHVVDSKAANTAPTTQANVPPSSTTKFGFFSWFLRLFGRTAPMVKDDSPQVNTFLSLKQGDKTITLAIVDGGNVGWTRLGRGGFEEHSMVPHGW